MQGIPKPLLQDTEPIFLHHDTDTAHPRTPIPIYYIHDLTHPFCRNPLCICQSNKRAVTRLLRGVIEGDLEVRDAAALHREAAMSNTSQTAQPTRTVIHVDLIPGVPVDCQMFGHDWQRTDYPGVKECTLCHIRGYCLVCTPVPPAGAQPFTCTYQTQQRQVQI